MKISKVFLGLGKSYESYELEIDDDLALAELQKESAPHNPSYDIEYPYTFIAESSRRDSCSTFTNIVTNPCRTFPIRSNIVIIHPCDSDKTLLGIIVRFEIDCLVALLEDGTFVNLYYDHHDKNYFPIEIDFSNILVSSLVFKRLKSLSEVYYKA